jgi:guanylate kinase
MTGSDDALRLVGRLCGAGPLLVILSGPSGAGKDAVLGELRRRGHPFHFVVTATTRERRADERDGIDYHFLADDAFRVLLEQGGLLEHEQYENGKLYGVPRSEVAGALRDGRDVVMRTDVRGVASIKRLVPAAVSIFVYPPSIDSLRRRMLARRSESEESLKRRLELARTELSRVRQFDYAVLNDDGALDRAVDQTEAIITAERCRVGRCPARLD